ncbi:MAG: hypothetical protein HW416_3981, partial [Chloroflexi bacterium]|nr:hypothetical protein [Chloroflexota bacterium]
REGVVGFKGDAKGETSNPMWNVADWDIV